MNDIPVDGFKVDEDRINDHKLDGDDVKELSKAQMKKLGRYERFEKIFPFYKMDVNGYIMHIKEAMQATHPDLEYGKIKTVNLESL